MHTIKHIPYKITYGAAAYQIKYDLFFDDDLYTRLSNTYLDGQTVIYNGSSLIDANPAATINGMLYSDVINDFYNLYVIRNPYSPVEASADYALYRNILAFMGMHYQMLTLDLTNQPNVYHTNGTCENMSTLTDVTLGGFIYENSTVRNVNAFNNQGLRTYMQTSGADRCYIQFGLDVFPSDVLGIFFSAGDHDTITLDITVFFQRDGVNILYADAIRINVSKNYSYDQWSAKRDLVNWNSRGLFISTNDLENPYGINGNSGLGGNDGTLKPGDLDSIDPAAIPELPAVSAADLGFITMYNPTAAQLKSLSSFMWSNLFDLSTYKKLFSDPMESVIGLAIVPVAPNIAGSKNVMFGSIDSGITMSYLSSNYVQLDCGSVSVERYIGSFMDNDPYTKISIYLPFIGIRQISADDVIGGSIHVVYNIDVLTGACACFIEHSTRGVLYSYNGSCITNVPLTAVNFSGAIQNAVSAVGSMMGIAAGMATGAAPITAMSAAGLVTSAANTAINSKPSVQRSGNLGGSAGILSILKPYVIIERPDVSVPSNVQHYVGQTSNLTMLLGDCSGFTMCEYVHIDGVSATRDEITEIESLLKAGVIL